MFTDRSWIGSLRIFWIGAARRGVKWTFVKDDGCQHRVFPVENSFFKATTNNEFTSRYHVYKYSLLFLCLYVYVYKERTIVKQASWLDSLLHCHQTGIRTLLFWAVFEPHPMVRGVCFCVSSLLFFSQRQVKRNRLIQDFNGIELYTNLFASPLDMHT